MQLVIVKFLLSRTLSLLLDHMLLTTFYKMQRLKAREHPNVLQMVGVCVERCRTEGEIYLLTPFCERGSLLHYLKTSKFGYADQTGARATYLRPDSVSVTYAKVTQQDLLSYCAQIAMGMQYLASVPILHRDLALRNVLLDKNGVVKIADFGLSRYGSIYPTNLKGYDLPIRWFAIEALLDNGNFTSKSDGKNVTFL